VLHALTVIGVNKCYTYTNKHYTYCLIGVVHTPMNVVLQHSYYLYEVLSI